MSTLQLQASRAVRTLPPSRWAAELSEAHQVSIIAADEPLSMAYVIDAMQHVWGVVEVDLSQLTQYELPRMQTAARRFFFSAAVFWEDLERLRVGPACLHMANGPNENGKWDVEYLIEAIPAFKSLRVLELPDLDLSASEGWDIMQACARCPTLRELDLSDNSLHQLDEVVDDENVVCSLESLNLSANALGEFDEESVGSDLTCHALTSLLTQYTSLRTLDLSTNVLQNREGRTIADALRNCTHLCVLNLAANHWDKDVDEQIRAAWTGPAEGLLL